MRQLVILPLLFATVSARYLGSHGVGAPSAISYHNTYKPPPGRLVAAASEVHAAPATYAVGVAPVATAASPVVVASHSHMAGAPTAISFHNTYRPPQRHHAVAAVSTAYAAPATYGAIPPATYVTTAPVVASHSHVVGSPSAISYHNTYRAPQRHHATFAAPAAYAASAPVATAVAAPVVASHSHVVGAPTAISYHNTYKVSQSRLTV